MTRKQALTAIRAAGDDLDQRAEETNRAACRAHDIELAAQRLIKAWLDDEDITAFMADLYKAIS